MAQRHAGKKKTSKPREDTRIAPRSGAQIDRIFGLLARKRQKSATLAEIKEAIERGWAGEK
jgi:hypothetical protein